MRISELSLQIDELKLEMEDLEDKVTKINKEKEDKIVEAILKNKVPKNLDGML